MLQSYIVYACFATNYDFLGGGKQQNYEMHCKSAPKESSDQLI